MFFFIIQGFLQKLKGKKVKKEEKKWKNIFGSKNIFPSEVEKHFWTISDGKIFLDAKSYEEKKMTSNLAKQKKQGKMRKSYWQQKSSRNLMNEMNQQE